MKICKTDLPSNNKPDKEPATFDCKLQAATVQIIQFVNVKINCTLLYFCIKEVLLNNFNVVLQKDKIKT